MDKAVHIAAHILKIRNGLFNKINYPKQIVPSIQSKHINVEVDPEEHGSTTLPRDNKLSMALQQSSDSTFVVERRDLIS